jgi:hypothetical protein
VCVWEGWVGLGWVATDYIQGVDVAVLAAKEMPPRRPSKLTWVNAGSNCFGWALGGVVRGVAGGSWAESAA